MILSILLQAQSEGTSNGLFGGGMGNIFLIVGIFVVFYFFMIRPQQKRQKEIRQFQSSLSNGTEVVTAGGIHGKIKEVKDNYLIVEIADNVRIKIDRHSVYATAQEQPAK